MVTFIKFTNTITTSTTILSNLQTTKKIPLTYSQTSSVGYINTGVKCDLHSNWEFGVVSLTSNLPSHPNNYGSVSAIFYIDGKVDDAFRFYLNGNHIRDFGTGWDANWGFVCLGMATVDSLHRNNTSFSVNLTQQSNTLSINAVSANAPSVAIIYGASITVTTTSK